MAGSAGRYDVYVDTWGAQMDVLVRIKKLVERGSVLFTEKAEAEIELDELEDVDVLESILNADRIDKIIRSRSRYRQFSGEKLYVIQSYSNAGTFIYTKGTIRKEAGHETFYVLVSAK